MDPSASFLIRYAMEMNGQVGIVLTERLSVQSGSGESTDDVKVVSMVSQGGDLASVETQFEDIGGKSARDLAILSSSALSVVARMKGASSVELLNANTQQVLVPGGRMDFDAVEAAMRRFWG